MIPLKKCRKMQKYLISSSLHVSSKSRSFPLDKYKRLDGGPFEFEGKFYEIKSLYGTYIFRSDDVLSTNKKIESGTSLVPTQLTIEMDIFIVNFLRHPCNLLLS